MRWLDLLWKKLLILCKTYVKKLEKAVFGRFCELLKCAKSGTYIYKMLPKYGGAAIIS